MSYFLRNSFLPLVSISILQRKHIRERELKLLRSEDPEALIIGNFHQAFLKSIPFRSISRVWGSIHTMELPNFLRSPLYRLWSYIFECNLEEVNVESLTSYKNLNEFFTRTLKDGVRPLSPSSLVCPCDGKVLHYGPIDHRSIEQVKGITYSLDSFLGVGEKSLDPNEVYHDIPLDPVNNQLYHCVIYLAPGDYHRFHAPSNWIIEKLKHFSGQLFSVSPGMVRMIKGLFVLNERIIMLGKWNYGFFSMSAVGATNVGSIHLNFDISIKTNKSIILNQDLEGSYDEKVFISII